MGTSLSIDEICLGGDVYTILSNPKVNKIVACIPGTKASIVSALIRDKISFEKRLTVKEVTLDMSTTMDWIVTQLFPQARQILDRFHVTKNVLEDIQAIRLRIKTLIKEGELTQEDLCKIDRRRYIPKKYENSETRLDFISRLHYQLFKRRKDWNPHQIDRWSVLVKHSEFDDIRVSYEMLEIFYAIYDEKISREEAKVLWNSWFVKISKYESILELQNTGRMVKKHLEGILNYFDDRSTNAFAE